MRRVLRAGEFGCWWSSSRKSVHQANTESRGKGTTRSKANRIRFRPRLLCPEPRELTLFKDDLVDGEPVGRCWSLRRRRGRGRRSICPGPLPAADRGGLHERSEREHAKAGEGRGDWGDAEQEQAEGEQESTDRGGDDSDDVVDEIVRDAEHDDEHEDCGDQRRVDLTRCELGPATQDPVDGCPREEPDEEREGDLDELREQDAPDDRADECEDEPHRDVRAQGGPDQETDRRAEQRSDERHDGGPDPVAPERKGEPHDDQDDPDDHAGFAGKERQRRRHVRDDSGRTINKQRGRSPFAHRPIDYPRPKMSSARFAISRTVPSSTTRGPRTCSRTLRLSYSRTSITVGIRIASPMTATVLNGSFAMMFSHIFLSGTPARAASTSDGSLRDMTRRFAGWLRPSSENRVGPRRHRPGLRVDLPGSPGRRVERCPDGAISGLRNLCASSRNRTSRGYSSFRSVYKSNRRRERMFATNRYTIWSVP